MNQLGLLKAKALYDDQMWVDEVMVGA